MSHYIIELAVALFIAYLLGVFIGWLLRNLFGSDAAVEQEAPARAAPAAAPIAAAPAAAAPVMAEPVHAPAAPVARPVMEPVVEKAAPAVAAAMPVAGKMERPKGIAAARGGKPDDLQRISGVGPKNEKILHSLGFFHFDQIAAWTAEQVAWVDDHLRFNGRIKREDWIYQCRLLADGKEEEFLKKFGTGGLRNKQGETLSGTRTRRS
ncbi:MAG: hypothetical protein U1E15_12525 [Hyphomicrobiales bacterium]